MSLELKGNNQYLSVDPLMGGAIKELTLSFNGKNRAVISPQKDYHYQSSLLFPFPNRLKDGRFEFGGKSYQFPLNDFGKPNALHGFIHDMKFEEIVRDEEKLGLACNYLGDIDYYPFPFDMQLTYQLEPGVLRIEVEITNTGTSLMPCSFGWHPYFNINDDADQVRIELVGADLIVVDETLIPTGKRTPYRTLEEACTIENLKLDNCFQFQDTTTERSTKLCFPDDTTLEVWQDRSLPFVQLYTPDDYKTIAIEPMSSNINALNTKDGLSLIKPKQSLVLNFGVSLH